MYVSDFILYDGNPSFQLYFPSDEFTQKVLGYTIEELDLEILKSPHGSWSARKDELELFKVEFYKINLLSEDLYAFKIPSKWDKVLIGRDEEFDDYRRMRVLDIGYFDIGEPFHTEDFYIQVGGETVQNFFGNNMYFYKSVGNKWKDVESFKVGQRKILEQNDIQKISQENSFLKEQLEKFEQSLNKIKFHKEFSEIEKLENELKALQNRDVETKQVSQKVENSQTPSKDFLIWSGKKLEDLNIKKSSFEEFKEKALKTLLDREDFGSFKEIFEPKDEFETETEFRRREKEFQIRKQSFEIDLKKRREQFIINSNPKLLNLYLGSQKIDMTYNPEKALFKVNYSNRVFSGDFHIEVPRNIARDFKNSVTNFDFLFSQDLVLKEITTTFQNREFFGKEFKEINLTEVEREREREREILLKTVRVGNLMFQDFDLPNRMNWNSACEYCEKLKLLGFSDWRLPEKDELQIAYRNKSRFKNIFSIFYWSKTKYNINASRSWVVNFDYGSDGWNTHNISNFVLCVRDFSTSSK